MTRIYTTTFAATGDKETLAATDPGTGKVSLPSGWTPDYEKVDSDPSYRPVGRKEMNGVINEVTAAVGELQQYGFAPWQALTGGWPLNARVVSGGIVYKSSIAANTAIPPAAPWVVDQATPLAIKDPVRFATTANIALSGLGAQAGGDWSGALTSDDRILVKNQSVGADNGWYAAAAGAWVRTNDANTTGQVVAGVLCAVSEGVTLADTLWMLTTDGPITIGTTALTFARKDAGAAVGVPPGTVMHTAASTAPSGYLKANGAAISRTTYSALFAAIGTTYGVGDGSTTFKLPDLRGEFIRGFDDGRGVDSERTFGSAQAGTRFPSLYVYAGTSSTGTLVSHPISSNDAYPNENIAQNMDSKVTGTSGAYMQTNLTPSGSSSLIAFTARPRNVALLACIKY